MRDGQFVLLLQWRLQLLGQVQATPELDPDVALTGALTTELHGEVAAMNRENFIVRMQLEAVNRFQQQPSWEGITEADANVLHERVAGLPSEIDTDEIESRLFDFTVLKMQVALADGDPAVVEKGRLAAGVIDHDRQRGDAAQRFKWQYLFASRLQSLGSPDWSLGH